MPTPTTQTFALDVERFCNKFLIDADTVVKKVLFDISTSIVMAWPVDTGRSRANWQFGEGSPPTGVIGTTPTYKQRKEGQVKYEDADSTIARLQAGIGSAKVLDNVLYIANNLPYALPLEYGWSKQAPNGAVRITIERYQEFMERAVQGIK